MVGRSTVEMTEQIRRACDVVEIVSAHVTLKRAGRALKGLCPFHNEKTPSFTVNPERQTFKCFGCGAGGDVFKFIQLRESVDFSEARRILAAQAGINLEVTNRSGSSAQDIGKTELERVNRWACLWFVQQLADPAGSAARAYVDSRGISAESVERFALGYAPDSWSSLHSAASQKGVSTEVLLASGLIKRREGGSGYYDAFRNRLIFPIRDAMERTIGFGGRALGDDPAKYINSPQSALFDKSRCLYGLSTAKHAFREARRAIVVEGYIDCLMAQQHGFPEAVATLGTALTLEHVQMLRRYVDEVILLFDADSAGQRAMQQSLPLFFTSQVDLRLAQVPEGKDPAELLVQKGPEALRNALTSATSALESKWNQVLRQCRSDASGPDMRRAVEEFLGLIAQSASFGTCDPIQRGLLVNQVGKLLGLSAEEVQRQLRITARRMPGALMGGSEPVVGAPQALSPDAAGAAMKDLLEVLLNEPSYYDSVRSEFDSALLGDTVLRGVADAVADLGGRPEGFAVAELIGRFEDVEYGDRITDLQIAGERGGNYAARVEGAVATLQKVRDRRRVGSLMAGLREGEAEDVSSLRAAGEAARRMSHFAARRHMTATPVIVGAAPSDPQNAD